MQDPYCSSREPINVRALKKHLRREGYCEHNAPEIVKELSLGLWRLEIADFRDIYAAAFKVVSEEAPQSLVLLIHWINEGGQESRGVLARSAIDYDVYRSTITREIEAALGWFIVGLLKTYQAHMNNNGWAHVWHRVGRYFVNCVHK
jgi:hypothetical protein